MVYSVYSATLLRFGCLLGGGERVSWKKSPISTQCCRFPYLSFKGGLLYGTDNDFKYMHRGLNYFCIKKAGS